MGGVRIIDRVARAVRAHVPDLLLVSNDPRAPDWLPGVPVVCDVRAERGSLVGIHTALSHGRQNVLVVAWDMPFISTEIVALLDQRARASRYAVVPETTTGLEPMCAVYSVHCLPFLEAAIDEGDLRITNFLARLPSYDRIEPIELARIGNPVRMFFNVNDASDLAIANRMAAG